MMLAEEPQEMHFVLLGYYYFFLRLFCCVFFSHVVFSIVISNTGGCGVRKQLTAWLALVTSFSFMLMLGSCLKGRVFLFFLLNFAFPTFLHYHFILPHVVFKA